MKEIFCVGIAKICSCLTISTCSSFKSCPNMGPILKDNGKNTGSRYIKLYLMKCCILVNSVI